jgi:hypothetical protein
MWKRSKLREESGMIDRAWKAWHACKYRVRGVEGKARNSSLQMNTAGEKVALVSSKNTQ